jgi:hypothetical protein
MVKRVLSFFVNARFPGSVWTKGNVEVLDKRIRARPKHPVG